MLKVIASRSFWNKEKTKEYHVCDVVDDQGNIAIDCFTDKPIPVGTFCDVAVSVYNHKLRCGQIYPIIEKK